MSDVPDRDALRAPDPRSPPDDRARRTAVGEARPGDMPLAGGKKLQVSVISPHEVGFEGEADGVIAPAHDGMLGILYGHAPMVVLLGEGDLIVRRHWQHDLRFHVSRGFLQVVDNQVSVLAEEVRPLEDMPRLDPDELQS